MNRKFLILAIVALVVGAALVPAAFAANNNYGEWYDQMFQWHHRSVDSAVENGEISEQQAEEWRDHFNYMNDFHREQPMGSACGGYYGNSGDGANNKNANSTGGEMMIQ